MTILLSLTNIWSMVCYVWGEHLKHNIMKNSGLCIFTLLGGALMGAAITMLVTPKTGRQMRDTIRDFVNDELEKMRCKCHDAEHHHDQSPVM
jgi:hypothetical protein